MEAVWFWKYFEYIARNIEIYKYNFGKENII